MTKILSGLFFKEFQYLETISLVTENEASIKQNIFVSIFKYLKTQDIYIIFSCSHGGHPISEWLWSNECKKYISTIQQYILPLKYRYSILCGHSQGGVFALRLGYEVFIEDNRLFNERCTVIASGSYKWLKKEHQERFNNLPNIKSYIMSNSGYPNSSKAIDNQVFEGPEEFTHYFPIQLIDEKDNTLLEVSTTEQLLSKFSTSDSNHHYHHWTAKYLQYLKKDIWNISESLEAIMVQLSINKLKYLPIIETQQQFDELLTGLSQFLQQHLSSIFEYNTRIDFKDNIVLRQNLNDILLLIPEETRIRFTKL